MMAMNIDDLVSEKYKYLVEAIIQSLEVNFKKTPFEIQQAFEENSEWITSLFQEYNLYLLSQDDEPAHFAKLLAIIFGWTNELKVLPF